MSQVQVCFANGIASEGSVIPSLQYCGGQNIEAGQRKSYKLCWAGNME